MATMMMMMMMVDDDGHDDGDVGMVMIFVFLRPLPMLFGRPTTK